MIDRAEPDRGEQLRSQLLRAFPSVALSAAHHAVDLVPPAEFSSPGLIQETNNAEWPEVTIHGEHLEIPNRIYNVFPAGAFERLTPPSRAAAGCIYTRHPDGRTRQRALGLALSADMDWCAPFVVQLLGEYVVEICIDIEEFLADGAMTYPNVARGLQHFAGSNPAFIALTRARATSYWSEYYRTDFPHINTYPAIRALDQITRQA
ncbi:hypothetical protein [Nocardioides sp. NPDC127503]|uniref:hypothetical protein n=1 Tax=Nocardioides sp. NPDC127503 TaxID=3154516 RepID=UPI00332BD2CD